MIAMCWPKLPLKRITRVTSGRLLELLAQHPAERSRLPSFTNTIS
jgi:hypothetical protein